MTQFKILMDSNVYLRLAQSIHPLLFESFGPKNFTLFLIKGFQKEFDRNPTLKSDFFWVNDPVYRENRKYRLKISRAELNRIELTNSYLWEQNTSEKSFASRIDVEALAYALVLEIPIVTDDRKMADLGKTHGVKVWGILDLLELMYKNKHINKVKITEIGEYLFHYNDLPYPRFLNDLKKRFKGL